MRLLLFSLFIVLAVSCSTEYHVAVDGDDANDGSKSSPLQTISAAAQLAQPGDVITVHEGVYRERINPPRGGESDKKRITYQTAQGEKVVIKGSEVVTGWEPLGNGVWKVVLPNSFFGDYNPYQDIIAGDWHLNKGRDHHTGEVYLNGQSLFERATLEEIKNPQPHEEAADQKASTYVWCCESNDDNTTIWANFHEFDPNEELVEIHVREACFYPDTPGRHYITVRGFQMRQAATQWAAPTAEQIAIIGTHWSKGWIIEDNIISDSKCVGITLGKDRATGHNVWSKDKSKGGDVHYNECIVRALEAGWSKETIGSHIVRNNTIYNCEAAGICGSMGVIFSEVTNNHIYNIEVKRQYTGHENAAIKFHGAINTLIRDNHIHDANKGIWLDWMTQGTRVTGNLCYNNFQTDLFVEMNHGPFVIDNNIFLSDFSLWDWSQGGAYAHNLFAGNINSIGKQDKREVPYHLPNSTELAGKTYIRSGDNRFYNNIFLGGPGLAFYDKPGIEFPVWIDANVYANGAQPYSRETHYILADAQVMIELDQKEDGVFFSVKGLPDLSELQTPLVTTELLGNAKLPDAPFNNYDGSALVVDVDYYGRKRTDSSPVAGPFHDIFDMQEYKVFPKEK